MKRVYNNPQTMMMDLNGERPMCASELSGINNINQRVVDGDNNFQW